MNLSKLPEDEEIHVIATVAQLVASSIQPVKANTSSDTKVLSMHDISVTLVPAHQAAVAKASAKTSWPREQFLSSSLGSVGTFGVEESLLRRKTCHGMTAHAPGLRVSVNSHRKIHGWISIKGLCKGVLITGIVAITTDKCQSCCRGRTVLLQTGGN